MEGVIEKTNNAFDDEEFTLYKKVIPSYFISKERFYRRKGTVREL
jgi:hypothetical protein